MPSVAVRVSPTSGVPVIDGAVRFVTASVTPQGTSSITGVPTACTFGAPECSISGMTVIMG